MKCEWQTDCSKDGIHKVYRALSEEESQMSAHGEGVIWSIPLYQHKTVCNECVDTARQTFSITQAEVDADDRL